MARRGRPKHPDILTPREWEVLELLREGLTNEQIGERLGVTIHAARYHVSEILSKLGVGSREEAARWQPEERRRWSLAVPLTAAKAAGVAVVAAAVVGLGVLAWGVLSTGGGSDGPGDGGVLGSSGITESAVLFLPPASEQDWFVPPSLLRDAEIAVADDIDEFMLLAPLMDALIIDVEHLADLPRGWLREQLKDATVIVGARMTSDELADELGFGGGPVVTGSRDRLHYALRYEINCDGGRSSGAGQDYTDFNREAQSRSFLRRLQSAIDRNTCE